MSTIDKPVVKVVCQSSGNDWSDYVTHFKYEDCTDKADMLEIRFSDDYALRAIDSPDFRQGSMLKVQWGYCNGVMSKIHNVVVRDVEARYSRSVDATVRCLDATKGMNSSCRTYLWENVTSSDIARKIAKKYNLSAVVDDTSKVWTSIPQSNVTDFDFLKSLADKELNGNFESFVRGGTLYFRKRQVDAKSAWTVQYGDEDFIEFSPKNRSSTKETSDDGVKLVGVDSFNKQVMIDIVKQFNLTDQTDLGVKNKQQGSAEPTSAVSKVSISKVSYDADGNRIDAQSELKNENDVTAIGTGGMSQEEKVNMGNGIVKSGKDNENTGSLTLVGNPLMEAGSIVTVKRVANYHAGNWMVKKVQTLIDKSGYRTILEVTRSMAAIKDVKNGSAKVNTTEGENSSNSGGKRAIRRYNANGEEIK